MIEGATTKGIFLKEEVNYLRKKMGEPGVKKLVEVFGPVNFSSIKNYPETEEARLLKAIAKIISPDNPDEEMKELGSKSVEVYLSGVLGKTIFSLMGNDVKNLAMAITKIFSTITKGIEISAEDLGKNRVRITHKNNPIPAVYYEGIWSGALRYLKIPNYTITPKIIDSNNYAHEIEWGEVL